MANEIAISRKQEIFAVKETTRGTLVFPAASNYIIGAGYAKIDQQPSFTDSQEVVDTRDVLQRFQDRFSAGEFEIPHYARPSGSAGTAPMADVLYECFFGVKTVNGGTSVVYSQALTKPSFSLWVKKDHTVFFGRGATVSKLAAELTKEGAYMFTSSGGFMELGWCGTDSLNGGEPISETAVVVNDARKYKLVGSKVEFVSSGTVYNNSNSGYAITDINYTTETVTISPGLEIALNDADIIRPFLPTGTVVGAPIESRKGVAVVDSVSTPVKAMSYEINDPAVYLEDEITTTEYVESYVEDKREITGELSVYFRQNDTKYYYEGINNNVIPLKTTVGTTAGSIVELSTPQSTLEVPAAEEDEPTISLVMPFTAQGSSGEDSCTLTFK